MAVALPGSAITLLGVAGPLRNAFTPDVGTPLSQFPELLHRASLPPVQIVSMAATREGLTSDDARAMTQHKRLDREVMRWAACMA